MINFARTAALGAVLAGLAMSAAPAAAAPTAVTGTKPQAKAQIVKPLVLSKVADLDFGTVVMVDLTSDQTVSFTEAGGKVCGAGLTCTGGALGSYKVEGVNNAVVNINTPDVTMTGSGGSLLVKLNAPKTLRLTNSGTVGTTFKVGGSFTVTSTTKDGLYAGDMDVTVEYQ